MRVPIGRNNNRDIEQVGGNVVVPVVEGKDVDEESKDAFVREVQESEGIQFEKDKVVKNWRKIAKDMLNNFWGKYGQSDELSKTEFIHDPRKFLEKVRSKAC